MIKFKQLLQEGHAGRSKPISKSEFESLLNSKASAFNPDGTANHIYRGIDGFGYDFAKIDPREHQNRESAYAKTNYYTLIINNSQEWKRYPKRELSCTTSTTKASGYGDVYIVIPFNGVEWGICPNMDIFFSFDKLENEVGFDSINQFFKVIQRLFLNFLDSQPNKNSFQDLKDHLQMLGQRLDDIGFFDDSYDDQLYKDGFENLWKPYLYSIYYEYNEFDEFVFDLLDPEDNDFELQKQWRGAPDNREVWTDGPCLLYRLAHKKQNPYEISL